MSKRKIRLYTKREGNQHKILLNRIKRTGKVKLIVKEIPQENNKSTTDPFRAVDGFKYSTKIDCHCCGKRHEIIGEKLPKPIRNTRGVLCTWKFICPTTQQEDYFHLGKDGDIPLP